MNTNCAQWWTWAHCLEALDSWFELQGQYVRRDGIPAEVGRPSPGASRWELRHGPCSQSFVPAPEVSRICLGFVWELSAPETKYRQLQGRAGMWQEAGIVRGWVELGKAREWLEFVWGWDDQEVSRMCRGFVGDLSRPRIGKPKAPKVSRWGRAGATRKCLGCVGDLSGICLGPESENQSLPKCFAWGELGRPGSV